MRNKIVTDNSGATIVEFAILAPIIIGLMLGVLQIGLGMQSYSAMRGVASDSARYATIEYQKEVVVANSAIETWAESRAAGAPYLLQSNFNAAVSDAGTQRVDGATEKTITVTYTPQLILPFMGWVNPTLTFSRPIFLLQP
ncbi:MAG: TadE/TadG family type IV pilus assembly protein [Qipengyuania sp.]